MNNINFSVITGSVINNIINEYHSEVYETIKDTYLEHHANNATNPPSYFLKFPENPKARIIALPAAINSEHTKIAGIKWIGSYPDNITKGIPRASAVIILNDYITGFPYTCMEGSIISAVRTSYSAVLAAEYLHQHKKSIDTLGVIGTGYIAKNILKCLKLQNWQINNILIYDNDIKRAQKFIKEISELGWHSTISFSKDYLINSSDTIAFCTTALEPHVIDTSLFKHHPKVLHISLRDLSPDILLQSDNIVDDIEHVLNANTSPHLAFQKVGHPKFVNGTLGDLINEKITLSNDKTNIFSPMGMGILDLALANFIYQKATNNNLSTHVEEFFNEVL